MKKATNILLGLAAVLLLTGVYFAFFVAPIAIDDNNNLLIHQKILYFHVPIAETSLIFLILGAVFGVLFLTKKERKYDFLSLASVELGFVFGLLVEFSGVMWDKAAWGVWWTWEPRLLTYLILMLMYAGYFVLRSSIGEESAKARLGAVYSVVAAITVPITFLSIRIYNSVHPTIFTREGSGLEGPMLAAFLISMFGMAAFGIALMLVRYQVQVAREELDFIKNELGG